MRPHLFVLAALALPAPALAVEPGLRVMVQPWTPLTDDDTPLRPIDDPHLLSNALHDAWSANTDDLHDALRGLLGKGDLLADGVTLYDLDLRVPEPTLALDHLSGGGQAPLAAQMRLHFDDVHLTATSTTPDVALGVGAGDWADPRCSFDFDLTATIPFGVGTDVARPLFAQGQATVRITDFRFDSHNAPCDVIKEVIELVGLDGELTRLVTDPNTVHAQQLDATLTGLVHQSIDSANAAVASVVPSGLVRLSAWATRGQPLTLAFGVRGPLPDAGPRASISGAFVSATGQTVLTRPVDCQSLPVVVSRKTGPRPILDATGQLGPAPMEPVQATLTCSTASYTLAGLSSAFPQQISLGSSSGCDTSNPASIAHIVEVEGLPEYLLPHQLSQRYDLVAEAWSRPCGAQTREVLTLEDRRISPYVNPPTERSEVIDTIRVAPIVVAPR
jgi:hypothetical protein